MSKESRQTKEIHYRVIDQRHADLDSLASIAGTLVFYHGSKSGESHFLLKGRSLSKKERQILSGKLYYHHRLSFEISETKSDGVLIKIQKLTKIERQKANRKDHSFFKNRNNN